MGCCGLFGRRCTEQTREEVDEEAAFAQYCGWNEEQMENYRDFMLNFSLETCDNYPVEELTKY